MSMPFFSIVVPVHNTAPYLSRCVESLLKQSFGDFEIFLVDDGSTDGSADVVDALQDRDLRVNGIHIRHAGVSAARNTGLKLAQGSYVLFVDSDDVLVVPDALERMYKCLGDMPEMLSYGILARSAAKTELPGHSGSGEPEGRYRTISETADDCIRGSIWFMSACTHAYRLSVIREHKIRFREGLAFGEDRLFNWNFLRHCRRLFYMEDKLYIYTDDREGSGSHRFVAGMLRILTDLQEENTATMLALCGDSISEREKDRFRAKCFVSAVREAWKHLKLYYPSLSKEQRSQGLRGFLALRFPGCLNRKTLRRKQLLWISGLRLAVKLHAVWLLKIYLFTESISFGRNKR